VDGPGPASACIGSGDLEGVGLRRSILLAPARLRENEREQSARRAAVAAQTTASSRPAGLGEKEHRYARCSYLPRIGPRLGAGRRGRARLPAVGHTDRLQAGSWSTPGARSGTWRSTEAAVDYRMVGGELTLLNSVYYVFSTARPTVLPSNPAPRARVAQPFDWVGGQFDVVQSCF